MRNITSDAHIDLRQWYHQHGADNSQTLQRLLTYLPQAVEQELTARQRQIVEMYFYNEMSVCQIAQELSLNPSSVSRTLHRATDRLMRVLRYTV